MYLFYILFKKVLSYKNFIGSLFNLRSSGYSYLIMGFKSGYDINNSEIYPGIGFPSLKTNGLFRIAQIVDDFGHTIFGFNPGKRVKINSENVQFFYDHPSLKWISTTKESISNVSGIIDVHTIVDQITYVGRVNLTNERNETYQQIGIYYETDSSLYYWNGSAVETHSGIFDVLACDYN